MAVSNVVMPPGATAVGAAQDAFGATGLVPVNESENVAGLIVPLTAMMYVAAAAVELVIANGVAVASVVGVDVVQVTAVHESRMRARTLLLPERVIVKLPREFAGTVTE